MNGLAARCSRVGLSTPSAVAKLLGIDENDAAELLSDSPPVQVVNILRLLDEVRLSARPFSFWMKWDCLNQLFSDNRFRADLGMLPFPATRGDLTVLVRKLRGEGLSYEMVAAAFNRDRVPRATPWTAANADADAVKGPRLRKIEVTDEYRTTWHNEVVDRVLGACCPPDPVAFVRWSLESATSGGLVVITGKAVPAGPRKWITRWLSGRTWLTGCWGLVDH